MLENQEIRWSTVASRGLLFSILWWILTDGSVPSWTIGAPAVIFAVMTSVALLPPVPLAWRGLFHFVPFFVWRSVLGAVDVASRAFHPRVPIDPLIIDYPLRLPPGLPQVIMANIVSLLPGTLSTTLDGRTLQIHVLDGRVDPMTGLQELEQRVAQMFAARLMMSTGSD